MNLLSRALAQASRRRNNFEGSELVKVAIYSDSYYPFFDLAEGGLHEFEIELTDAELEDLKKTMAAFDKWQQKLSDYRKKL